MNPRLVLATSQNTLFLYNCSIRMFHLAHLKRKLSFEFEILSPEWDRKKVIKKILHNDQKTIDDILLDQKIFPGVGNIIKNETLFLSKIRPTKKISKISLKKINEVALNARSFSETFLRLRKNFELKKNLKIYRKSSCPLCGTIIKRLKTGKTNRWSYFCPKCQK